MGRDKGVTEDQLAELGDYEASAAFDSTEKLCLRLADAMTATPADISDELFEGLRALFSSAAIVELTSTIAWENYRARQNRALGIESDGFAEGVSCPMPVRQPQNKSRNAPASSPS